MDEPVTGAELFLRAVAERGIRFIFINPGTDTFPIQEAYAKMQAEGQPLPEMLLCPFESLACSAAQGAFFGTGQAQVALVHVDVGTANAAGALNNAKANRIPVLLCAGRSPVSLEPVPGGRSKYINWLQDVPDQAALVRNYVKNEQIAYQPEAIPRTVNRALQVAESEPAGPAYVMFPREGLMAETTIDSGIDPSRFRGVGLGGADEADVARLADWLIEAERPILVAGYSGRDTEAVAALTELAEVAGVGVVEYRGRVNFPLTHRHHLGFDPATATTNADLLITLEHDVPYVPVLSEPPPETKLVHIGADPYFETIQTWGFPSDLGIRARPRLVLERLVAHLRERLTPADEARVEDRRRWLADRHEQWTREAWAPSASPPGQPATPTLVGQIINESLPEEATIFEEAVTSANPIALQLQELRPGSFFRNGGSYLGWAVGAAIGYGLARDDRIPVALVGDGSFLFAVPSAALWLARRHEVPLLTIVVDNSAYNSVRLAARDGYPEGWQVQQGYVATDFEETPRAEALAEACGIAGFRAEDGREFRSALKSAVEIVRAGKPALVAVTTTLSERAT